MPATRNDADEAPRSLGEGYEHLEANIDALERRVKTLELGLGVLEGRVRGLRDAEADRELVATRVTTRPPPPVLGDADELEPEYSPPPTRKNDR